MHNLSKFQYFIFDKGISGDPTFMVQENMTIDNKLYPDLRTVQELLYNECGFTLSNLNVNSEGKEYSACSFTLNGNVVVYRLSKITPTKTGQFVTLWKRNYQDITVPLDSLDNIDFVVITSQRGNTIGQFIFPTSVLIDKGVMSELGKGGKRGMRVYPSWDTVTNKQAEKTQTWQLNYFVRLKDLTSVDRTHKLFNKVN